MEKNMNNTYQAVAHSKVSILETNRVIKNTYLLLSMTLMFSALTAGISMAFNLPHPGFIITLVGYFGLLFLTNKFQNSAMGLVFIFALTGFMGMTLGPVISHYINAFSNGTELVMMAMGGTGLIFLSLSAYALTTRKDFSFMGGFLSVGVLVAFVAGLVGYFAEIPALSLAVSAAVILLMSALILYETSQIIYGGERNYIMATVTLYIALYNLFVNLLMLLGFFGGEE